MGCAQCAIETWAMCCVLLSVCCVLCAVGCGLCAVGCVLWALRSVAWAVCYVVYAVGNAVCMLGDKHRITGWHLVVWRNHPVPHSDHRFFYRMMQFFLALGGLRPPNPPAALGGFAPQTPRLDGEEYELERMITRHLVITRSQDRSCVFWIILAASDQNRQLLCIANHP